MARPSGVICAAPVMMPPAAVPVLTFQCRASLLRASRSPGGALAGSSRRPAAGRLARGPKADQLKASVLESAVQLRVCG